ncbi:MAG: sulfatase-like hydrolase/transferase, partial [Planctomycetes bacterium]|nr:sulfatase-like hydrolase/transferase [Planctomycetota bacterium]
FYGMIENIDENVGRLMRKLEEWKLLENTVVIFMSDNGMTGGGSGNRNRPIGRLPDGTPLEFYNAGMKGLKGSPDEGGVRVPFFVRWDGRIQPGRDIDRIAAHLDILPTLAALAGAETPKDQVEGRNLLPLIKDPNAKWEDRYLFTHVGRWPTGADPDEYQWRNFSVRNQRYRFVNNDALYDMEQDPGQMKNIIEQHPEVAEKMRAAYDAWWQETRPMMVNEEAPMSPTRPYHELYRKQTETTGIPDWKEPTL